MLFFLEGVVLQINAFPRQDKEHTHETQQPFEK